MIIYYKKTQEGFRIPSIEKSYVCFWGSFILFAKILFSLVNGIMAQRNMYIVCLWNKFLVVIRKYARLPLLSCFVRAVANRKSKTSNPFSFTAFCWLNSRKKASKFCNLADSAKIIWHFSWNIFQSWIRFKFCKQFLSKMIC